MVTIADFNQDRYAATDEVRCITIYVPDDDSYLPLLAGLLSLPGYQTNYQDPESAQAEGVAAVWRDAYILTDWEGCPGAIAMGVRQADVWTRFAQVSGGTLTKQNADYMTWRYYMLTDTTANRNLLQYVYLFPGEWQYRALYSKTTSSGIWYSKLQGVDTAQFLAFALDMYGLANAEHEISTSFTWTETGLVEFSQYNLGAKNAASAGYQAGWLSHHFWWTGES